MTVESIILSILLPLVCGSAPIIGQIIHENRKRSNLKFKIYTDMRLKIYKQFESDFADWSHNKTAETTANLYNAANAICLAGSEETVSAAAKLTDIVRKWELQKNCNADAIMGAHITLLKAMRTDLQTQAPKIKRQKQKTGQRV